MLKRVASLVCVFALATSLAACSAPSQKPKETEGEAQATETAETDGELALWHYWDTVSHQEALINMAKEYEENGGKKIDVMYIPYTEYMQKLLVTAAGGQLPALMVYDGNSTATLVESGILTDLTDKIEESGVMDNAFEGVVAEHKIGGKLYGFPVYANCLALFYRSDLIENPPQTLDELYTIAKEVTTEDMHGFVMSAIAGEESSFQFLPFIWSAGEDLNNVAAPGSVKALDLFSKMIKEGIMSQDVLNLTQQDARIAFETGRAAMMLNGPWNVAPLQENAPDMEWDLALIPRHADGKHASILGGESFGVGSNANVDEIWSFVEYMMEPDRYVSFLRELGQLPADTELAKDPYYTENPISALFIKQLESAQPRVPSPKYNEMSKALQTAIGAALSGSMTAEEALNEAATTITPLYEEYLASNQ